MNGGNRIPHYLPTLDGKNQNCWHEYMKSLFDFQDTIEVVISVVSKLATYASEAQCNLYKYSKKKDCNASFCIQSTVDGANFDRISHVESAK